ncbi:MAG: nuclear transport factor 2 family protein [Acidimicrobiia bacterium]
MSVEAVSGSALDVVRAFVERFVRREVDAALELLHEDVVVHECDSVPYAGDHQGKAAFVALAVAVRDVWEFKGRPSVRFFEAPDGAVAVIRNAAASRATGRSIDLRFTEVYTVRDGRIAEIEMFYWDTAEMAAVDGGGGAPDARC